MSSSRSARSARARSSLRDSSRIWARDSSAAQVLALAGRVGAQLLELGGVRPGHFG
jgi:hypothetical protein